MHNPRNELGRIINIVYMIDGPSGTCKTSYKLVSLVSFLLKKTVIAYLYRLIFSPKPVD